MRIKEVALSTSSLTKTLEFWQDLLEMQVVSKDANEVVLNYDVKSQANLRFVTSTNGVDHATAFGRIAFSIPAPDLPPLEAKIKEASLGTVKTPLVVLPTPGKADVQVVILEDHVSFHFQWLKGGISKNSHCKNSKLWSNVKHQKMQIIQKRV